MEDQIQDNSGAEALAMVVELSARIDQLLNLVSDLRERVSALE